MAVSGWLSTNERWATFSDEWNQVLAKYGVPHFHMREFAHFRGPYSQSWKEDEPKRIAFIHDLLGVISHHATAGFACLVESKDYQQVNREYQVAEHFGSE